MRFKCFAVTAPGIELITKRELTKLYPSKTPQMGIETGGIEFDGTLIDLYKANFMLRTATRVLVRIGKFHSSSFSSLVKEARVLPWENYVIHQDPLVFRVSSISSSLYHTSAIQERIVRSIEDRLGKPIKEIKMMEQNEEDSLQHQLVVVKMENNVCTISIDSSGPSLHLRGYKIDVAKAPLRETLASAMLMQSNWDFNSPLVDPFCGSGTIPIEAGLLAQNIPPGFMRKFRFMRWPMFEAKHWISVRDECMQQKPTARECVILASDRDQGAIDAALSNARRAGVENTIHFECKPLSEISPPPGCESVWIVTNPPYGIRIGDPKRLDNLYAKFGQVLASRNVRWNISLLNPAASNLPHQMGLVFMKDSPTFMHGGKKIKIFQGIVEKRS